MSMHTPRNYMVEAYENDYGEGFYSKVSKKHRCNPKYKVDLALDEILWLQQDGPSDDDVLTILEIEQRAHENGLQENVYWLDRILQSYQSRIYYGDVGASFEVQDEGHSVVRKKMTPLTAQLALQRVLPYPCKKQYTLVILLADLGRAKT